MAFKFSKRGNYLVVEDTIEGTNREYPSKDIRYKDYITRIVLNLAYNNESIFEFDWTEAQDADGVAFATKENLLSFLRNTTGSNLKLTDGAADVIIQSPVSDIIIVPVSRLLGEDELAVSTAIDDMSIVLADATGITPFDLITIYNVAENRVFFATVLAINVNTLDLDTPLDFAFPIGSIVSYGDKNLNANGSVTPVVYGVRNPTATDLDIEVDFTRMIIHFETSSGLDLSKFGDIIGGLDNGLVCRQKDGTYKNIFNVKTNGELQELMYDFSIIPASGNQQDGATGRFTFEKLGSVVRLKPFEDLQFIVQDDLTSIDLLTIVVQGATVTNF